jgi:hypothetical protein
LILWCISWSYECRNCKKQFDGKYRKFLMTLPAYICAAYPVHPTYATSYGDNYGDFHLSYSLSDGLDESMLTESSAHAFSKRIHKWQGREYKQRVQTYYLSTPGARLEDYLDDHSCFGRAMLHLEPSFELCMSLLRIRNCPSANSAIWRGTVLLGTPKCQMCEHDCY